MKSDTPKNLKESLSSKITKEIHSNEFFYKHIAELTPDAVVIHSGGKIRYANPGAVKLVQATNVGELIGKPVMKFIHKDSVPLIQERIKKMLSQSKVAPFVEEKFITVKGNIIYVETKAVPFTFQGEKAILAIIRDITARKQVERNLQFLSEANNLLSSSLDYRTTLANITALAVPHIADWCVVDMKTEKGIEQLAVAHVDSRKVKWAKELRRKNPPDPNAKTGVPQILRTGKTEYYYEITDKMLVATAENEEQLELLRKLKFSSIMMVPIRVTNETMGVITFVSAESGHHYTKTDLTIAEELSKRAGLAIESALLYSQAQQAITVRDEFITLASHELKTPLASIKMYGQILHKQLEKRGDTALMNFLEKMDQQTDRLTLLVNDLLNVSKIQHGKLEYNFEDVDLTTLVHDIVEVMRQVSLKHTIFIEGEIKKTVRADPFRIYQVLTNLLTNAIKYSPEADKILVRLSTDKKFVKITVQDFGIGIDPDHQEKVFDQFYRIIDPNKRKFSGLGMGLFISHEIIDRHGGSMSVKSDKGKGSQFSFTLPSVAHAT